jgi:hypothetical protein
LALVLQLHPGYLPGPTVHNIEFFFVVQDDNIALRPVREAQTGNTHSLRFIGWRCHWIQSDHPVATLQIATIFAYSQRNDDGVQFPPSRLIDNFASILFRQQIAKQSAILLCHYTITSIEKFHDLKLENSNKFSYLCRQFQ